MNNDINKWTAKDLAQNPERFRQALKDQIHGPTSNVASEPESSWMMRIAGWILLGAIASIAPFIVLIRSALWLYHTGWAGGWVPLLFGVLITSLLLLGYVLWMMQKFTGRWRWNRHLLPVLTGIVLMFCLYGGLYISRTHTKTDDLRQVYTSLHPIMRVSVTTATLFDKDLVITDLQRNPNDYKAMGLPVNERSLHFVQSSTGYVHATDLRTLHRPEWKNWLLQTYFRLMGFHTLRHTGTADHLHISIPPPES